MNNPAPSSGGASVRDAWLSARERLRAAAVPDPDMDARLLVAEALGLPRPGGLMARGDDPMPTPARIRLDAFLERRAGAREPVARILGRRGQLKTHLPIHAHG